jgi:hypothetical protein
MFGLIAFIAATAAAAIGYLQSRAFVRRRLRYVEGVHSLRAPLFAGFLALVVATPIVWILPIVGAGTAIVFGLGVGAGVAAGSKDIQHRRLEA